MHVGQYCSLSVCGWTVECCQVYCQVTSAPSLLTFRTTTKTASVSTFISWPSLIDYCFSVWSFVTWATLKIS